MESLRKAPPFPDLPPMLPQGDPNRDSPSTLSKIIACIETFFKETTQTQRTVAVCAIGSSFLFPSVAPGFIAIALSCLATRLAVKALMRYNRSLAERLTMRAYRTEVRFHKLRVFLVVAAVAMGFFYPPLGIVMGILTGIYLGLLSAVEKEIERQEKGSADTEQENDRLYQLSLA